MTHLVDRDGWLWPVDDRRAHQIIARDCAPDVAWVLERVPADRRGIAFQAGGCVGMYAFALSQHFPLVYTVEPDPLNFAALAWNLRARNNDTAQRNANIARAHAGLGETSGLCASVIVEAGNCGAHRITTNPTVAEMAQTPLVTIDGLQLPELDLLWLDIEGSELPALRGGRETIERFGPVIVTEEKRLGEAFGYRDEEIAAFLAGLGYTQAGRNHNDRLYLRTSTP